MTNKEYRRKLDERHSLCSLAVGRLWGTLVGIRESGQISENVKTRISDELAWVHSVIPDIYALGDADKIAAQIDKLKPGQRRPPVSTDELADPPQHKDY